MASTQFITDAQFNQYINNSIKHFMDRVVSRFECDYYNQSQIYTTQSSLGSYALPGIGPAWLPNTAYATGAVVQNVNPANFQALSYIATAGGISSNVAGATGPTGTGVGIVDGTVTWALQPSFYKARGVEVFLSSSQPGSQWITILPFLFSERNLYSWLPIAWNILGITNIRYRIVGGNLQFIPVPLNQNKVQLWYIPTPTPLVADTDTFDFVNGGEEWVILDVAIKAKIKEESDTTALEQMLARETSRLESMLLPNRDSGSPQRIGDVSKQDFWPFNGGGAA